jgi:hypothetical protein
MHGFLDALWNYGRIAIIPLLVLLNAFFVAAEFSLVTVRRTRLEEMVPRRCSERGRGRGDVRRLDDMIAAIQLGITDDEPLALGGRARACAHHRALVLVRAAPLGIFAATASPPRLHSSRSPICTSVRELAPSDGMSASRISSSSGSPHRSRSSACSAPSSS